MTNTNEHIQTVHLDEMRQMRFGNSNHFTLRRHINVYEGLQTKMQIHVIDRHDMINLIIKRRNHFDENNRTRQNENERFANDIFAIVNLFSNELLLL